MVSFFGSRETCRARLRRKRVERARTRRAEHASTAACASVTAACASAYGERSHGRARTFVELRFK
ncbi:hypothetical protein D0U02_26780 [Burkholderia pseudomallei]|nr:hypothetical protein AMS56_21260 [Burkholderia pseudomallei]ARL53256.1 hypothetical protein BOC51_26000 [Burkholderia pseudomallei]OAB15776.1 hypothetical protein AQ846_10665 [Burkholderia pseudomallei]OMR22794.1 hypothetical protein AQ720_10385 [Burkholderia pseudomallei]OMR32253.1 hypothetical protein AQ722_02000 [Burkholderia pseudomallei]